MECFTASTPDRARADHTRVRRGLQTRVRVMVQLDWLVELGWVGFGWLVLGRLVRYIGRLVGQCGSVSQLVGGLVL